MTKPAIIFDFGGVLLDIDYQATTQAFNALAKRELDFGQYAQAAYFDEIECGKISENQFYESLHTDIQAATKDFEKLENAFNAMLGHLPLEKINFLEEIRQKARIFLLSNTNSIHKRAFDKTLKATFAERKIKFPELFEGCYYSHLIGYRKPDPQAYTYILEKHQLNPLRSLFIDDNIKNVEAAKTLGIEAIHLTDDLLSQSVQQQVDRFLTLASESS